MRKQTFLSLGWRGLASGILGTAFLWVSAPKVWEALRPSGFGPILPYHTTNSYGVNLLHVQNASERILAAFAALPPQQPVAVILPEDDERSIFLSYLVGYFGWPREVRAIAITHQNAQQELQKLDHSSIAAIFFCGLEPPAGMRPVMRIGTGLTMVPLTSNPETPAP
ncbi:MAG: hypothetical protein ACR2HH_04635 [Chthoniobacterales bacterium]